jgi:hypothetical protein
MKIISNPRSKPFNVQPKRFPSSAGVDPSVGGIQLGPKTSVLHGSNNSAEWARNTVDTKTDILNKGMTVSYQLIRFCRTDKISKGC